MAALDLRRECLKVILFRDDFAFGFRSSRFLSKSQMSMFKPKTINQKMTHQSSVLMALSFILLLACQKGEPEISSLRELQGFQLDQDLVSVSSKTTPEFVLSGRCSSQFSAIEVSVDGGSQWMALEALASKSEISCSTTGGFKAELSFANRPLDKSKWSLGSYGHLRFRAVSELGYSFPLIVRMEHLGDRRGRVTAGASETPLTGGDFKLKGQISALSNAPTLRGGNYKVQGEVLW